MKLDSKLKGGLAWAGLVVVLAVPAANILLGQPVESTKVVSTPEADATADLTAAPGPTADPVETASVAKDPVKAYLSTGKKLPSYISGADSTANAAPLTLPAAKDPTDSAEQAVLQPEDPPIPLPRSARPRPKDATVAAAPSSPPAAPEGEAPLILTDQEVAAVQGGPPVPPADVGAGTDQAVVEADDLEEWDSGSLADYLARKGLLSSSDESQAAESAEPADYEGWLVDDGRERPRRRVNDSWFF